MSWTPIYADDNDFKLICDWLSDEDEIAFLLHIGEDQWIAKQRVDTLSPGRYELWHTLSGPLPYLRDNIYDDRNGTIRNPWDGWADTRESANRPLYFSNMYPGVMTMTVKPKGYEVEGSIGLSGIEWIGNHYRILGDAANPNTEKWWQRHKRWVKKQAIRIPRSGPLNGSDPEIWTFPSAYEKIKAGTPRDINP
jgi:hypothetical protein